MKRLLLLLLLWPLFAFGQASDGQTFSSAPPSVDFKHFWNGTGWDRARGNYDASVLTLAAASTSGTSADQVNYNAKCVKVVLDVTAITGATPSITITIQGKDSVSGKYFTVLAGAAVSTVSTTVYNACVGMTAAANAVANDWIPRNWRISYTIAGTTPAVTATVAALYSDD